VAAALARDYAVAGHSLKAPVVHGGRVGIGQKRHFGESGFSAMSAARNHSFVASCSSRVVGTSQTVISWFMTAAPRCRRFLTGNGCANAAVGR
jgi:hypothetical protein